MAPTRAPTVVRGHVATDAFSTIVDELTADLPVDLMWPNSVRAYASMRREAHVSAIYQGWTLQLRRCQWQLDGAGCRPEVVQMVADDLGLPVMGRDEPWAARVRGVSWHEHLRTALQALVYGHYGFELHAEVVDSRARLVGLYERPPWTVTDIHVDPKSGDFQGVTQDSLEKKLRAESMAWYCREREGANWAGVSLFRPVWPLTLIKREMIRSHATANRRFGMGVPVMEALPGTTPTPAQMTEASRLASAARVGDQAGASTPPGFAFKLIGLSGGVPDTLAFIRYLDESASRACLAQYLNLGSTETGSRALGTAFIDNLMLALETEAAGVCDVATRQVAARIVEWNWGPDEPVPQVVASGVGSRREVTAESLQLLLSSGALSSDPGLEEWVRREYRLPGRPEDEAPSGKSYQYDLDYGVLTIDERRAQIGLPPLPDGQGARLAAPSSTRAGRMGGDEGVDVTAAAGDGVDTERLTAEYEQATAAAAEEWESASTELVTALAAATGAELAAGMLVGLGALVVPPAVTAGLVSLVRARMVRLAAGAAVQAAAEVRPIAAVSAALPDETVERVGQAAQAIVDGIVSGYASGAAREAMRLTGRDVDVQAVADAVSEHLTELSRAKGSGWIHGNLSEAMTTAQAAGREAVLAQLPVGTRFQATEVNDRNRCVPCRDVDGTVYDTLAAALADYPTSVRFRACLGGGRCRGLVYPIQDGN